MKQAVLIYRFLTDKNERVYKQWCNEDLLVPCPPDSTSGFGAESESECFCKPGKSWPL